MSRTFDYLAGLSCVTDMDCQQLSMIYAISAALFFIGVCMIVGGEIYAYQARKSWRNAWRPLPPLDRDPGCDGRC
jgi:hypothetical protein